MPSSWKRSAGRNFSLTAFATRTSAPFSIAKKETSSEDKRRQSAKVSGQLRMLRAHGLNLKVVHTHRCQLSARGRTILAALQAARQITPRTTRHNRRLIQTTKSSRPNTTFQVINKYYNMIT